MEVVAKVSMRVWGMRRFDVQRSAAHDWKRRCAGILHRPEGVVACPREIGRIDIPATRVQEDSDGEIAKANAGGCRLDAGSTERGGRTDQIGVVARPVPEEPESV